MHDRLSDANLEGYQSKPVKLFRPFIERYGTPIKYAAGGGLLLAVAAGSINPAIFIGAALGYLVGYTKQVGDRNHKQN